MDGEQESRWVTIADGFGNLPFGERDVRALRDVHRLHRNVGAQLRGIRGASGPNKADYEAKYLQHAHDKKAASKRTDLFLYGYLPFAVLAFGVQLLGALLWTVTVTVTGGGRAADSDRRLRAGRRGFVVGRLAGLMAGRGAER